MEECPKEWAKPNAATENAENSEIFLRELCKLCGWLGPRNWTLPSMGCPLAAVQYVAARRTSMSFRYTNSSQNERLSYCVDCRFEWERTSRATKATRRPIQGNIEKVSLESRSDASL
jgi:hypothetical protein